MADDIATMSVKELKAALAARGVPFADCTEKIELVERLRAAPPPTQRPAPPRPPRPPPQEERKEPDAADTSPEAVEVRRVLACTPGEYYKILGVQAAASDDDVRKSYRQLALRLHPDKCRAGGADEAFKRIGHAFAKLKDPQERAAHDNAGGDAGGRQRHAGGTPDHRRANHFHHRQGFGDRDAEELFRAFFGEGDPFGGGGGGFGGGGAGTRGGRSRGSTSVAPASATEIVQRGLTLGRRLMNTFVANPWTLVTLLSALASLVSVAEAVVSMLGTWVVAVLPLAAMGVYACPPHQRRSLSMLALVVLCSPYFL